MNAIEGLINDIETFESSSEIIAIIVGKSSPEQLHCGIAFKEKDKYNALHLAWHFVLRHDISIKSEFKNYIWIQSSIHNMRQNAIGAMCRRIIKRNQNGIPYGLLYNGGIFTNNGLLTLFEEENGLTCATFVLAVFSSCGINLINLSSWPTRDEDRIWHNEIIQTLEETSQRSNITTEHINNVRNEIGCSRYKPEEVGASSIFNDLPASFSKIGPAGAKLKEILENS